MERKKIDLDTHLLELDFSVRLRNCIRATDGALVTVKDLCKIAKMDLLRWRNFGKKSLAELDNFMDNFGLRFGMSKEELAEYEGKPLKNDESTEELAENNINWEQRRWEIFAAQLPRTTDTWKHGWDDAFTRAWDDSNRRINMYKARLEKERKLKDR